jgi:hypothetical protein
MFAFGIVLLISLLGAVVTSGDADAAPRPGCNTKQVSQNADTIAGRGRQGAVNMSVYWCWDGTKITQIDKPLAWPSSTAVGDIFLEWNMNEPEQTFRDPQNGGNWTAVNTVKGTVQVCSPEVNGQKVCGGHPHPFILRLLVFGDGVVCSGVKC